MKPVKFESNLLKTNKVAEFYRRFYDRVISSLVLDVSSGISFLILRRPSRQWRCRDIRKLFLSKLKKENMEGWISRPHYNFREARWLSGFFFGLRIRRSHSRSCHGWLAPSRLLLSESGQRTVAGDYYGIWCEGDDGKGKRERKRLPFSVPFILRASLTAYL